MSVRVFPKVTQLQLQDLVRRHGLIARHDWTRGRLRVFVERDAHPLPPPPFTYICEGCDWAGIEPSWELVEVPDPVRELHLEAARCPRCRSFNIASRITA